MHNTDKLPVLARIPFRAAEKEVFRFRVWGLGLGVSGALGRKALSPKPKTLNPKP